ncbi:MAG: hypothetical protein ACRC2H_11585 [Silanimonas sp.]
MSPPTPEPHRAFAAAASRLVTASGPCPQLLNLKGDSTQWYFLQAPRRQDPRAPLLVSVHGVTRNALEHVQAFSEAAWERGCALLVPLFDERQHRRYQRLGRERRAPRADLAMLALLREARQRLRLDETPIRLFGYSGGGQFAHRFSLFYPEQVARVAIGAAGWYTFPDAEHAYPAGLADLDATGLPPLRLDAALRVPAAVYVGDLDNEHDAKFNAATCLVGQQGATRIERGQRWVAAMRARARAAGLDTPYRFELLPGANHSFLRCVNRGGLRERVLDFLLDPS